MLHSSELVRPFQVVIWDTFGENSKKKIHRATPLNPEESTAVPRHRRGLHLYTEGAKVHRGWARGRHSRVNPHSYRPHNARVSLAMCD